MYRGLQHEKICFSYNLFSIWKKKTFHNLFSQHNVLQLSSHGDLYIYVAI